jgi:S1-C subfamily serine protease
MKRIDWQLKKLAPFGTSFMLSAALAVILFSYMSLAIQQVVTYFEHAQVVVAKPTPTARSAPSKPSRPIADEIAADSYAFARQAVFKVIPAYGERKFMNSGGTGFLFKTENGQAVIITNKHVCNGVDQELKNQAILVQGNKSYFTTIRARSRLTDICILNVPGSLMEHRFYEVAKNPRAEYVEGAKFFVLGHPRLMPLAMVEALYLNWTQDYFDTDLPSTRGFGRVLSEIHPGNSGSPMVNKNNEVVGVIFAYEQLPDMPATGLFIPIEHALDVINGQE